MKKSYFIDVKLMSGEWVTLVYESSSRKGTTAHTIDFWNAAYDFKIDYIKTDVSTKNAYIMNEKNKKEQLFGDLRVIDLR